MGLTLLDATLDRREAQPPDEWHSVVQMMMPYLRRQASRAFWH
ncbi:MAG: hypothetical protein AAFN77_11250 [Planctomycetota bacterium]